jgi:hypothetical protein
VSLRSRLNQVAQRLETRGHCPCRCKGVQGPFAVWYSNSGKPVPVVEDSICERCGGVQEATLICVQYERPCTTEPEASRPGPQVMRRKPHGIVETTTRSARGEARS